MKLSRPEETPGTVVCRPGLVARASGWAVLALFFVGFVAVPLWQGRYYGTGQALFYCFLIALAGWWMHWTHRELRLDGPRLVVASPVHVRDLALDQLRIEIRTGWWTRIVVCPDFGLPASFVRPFWSPDPVDALRGHIAEDRITLDESPGIEEPGPGEL